MATVIAMYGLPRSGKSTIARRLSRQLGAPIVNRDALRLALHNQRYEPAAEAMVRALSTYMLRALVIAGHDTVIVDETNYSAAARAALIDSRWDLAFYEVPTSPEVCKERAVATGQPDLVAVIDAMVARREPLTTETRYAL